VPIKTEKYPSNWELASARALTVVRTMIGAGMPATRVSAASYGEFKPVAANDGADGKKANRRIEIVVVPDLSNLPGFEELKQAGDK
jgi:chemotaxis protein MotB